MGLIDVTTQNISEKMNHFSYQEKLKMYGEKVDNSSVQGVTIKSCHVVKGVKYKALLDSSVLSEIEN
jgi:hypothetical protein